MAVKIRLEIIVRPEWLFTDLYIIKLKSLHIPGTPETTPSLNSRIVDASYNQIQIE